MCVHVCARIRRTNYYLLLFYSFKFVCIHTCRAGILRNEKERERERERESAHTHTIILGHNDANGIFVFASPAKKNRT